MSLVYDTHSHKGLHYIPPHEVLTLCVVSDETEHLCIHTRAIVIRSTSESGGLVHARNRYNTESVIVLEHAMLAL